MGKIQTKWQACNSERMKKIVKRLNELSIILEVQEYKRLMGERCLRQFSGSEEEYLRSKEHMLQLQQMDEKGEINKKYHPDMANMQEDMDRHSGNANSFYSNAPDDADHDPFFNTKKIKENNLLQKGNKMTREELEEAYLYLELKNQHIISRETLLEKVGINAEEEKKRRDKEAQEPLVNIKAIETEEG